MKNQTIRLSGQMPENWEKALKILEQDLGLSLSDKGTEVVCTKGDSIAVESDGKKVSLTWGAPVQFYRALSLIPQPLTAC